MHAILFGMKRAFQASLRVMRRPLEPFGLTSARFDMLWCILQSDAQDDAYPLYQSEVRKRLGVTAATVTRMMKSLEALGLVRRKRDFFDRRQIVVSLTRDGLDRVRAAYAHFVERKAAERVVRSALGDEQPIRERPFDERSFDEQPPSDAVGRLGDLLDRIRKGFGDRADLHYRRYRGDPSAWLAPYGGSGSEGAV